MQVKITTRGEFLYLEYEQNGKRVRKSSGLKDTKANVAYVYRNVIPELERKLNAGVDTTQNYKLSYFLDKVLAKTKVEKKINTLYVYELGVKRFLKDVGDKNVEYYKVADIERFVENLNARTARAYIAPISLAFKLALKYDIIAKNPCSYADFPKTKRKERRAFDKQSAKSLLDYAEGELKTFLYVAFYTGARAGEILALTWDDVGDREISINKTLARGVINSPKNGKTRRVLLLEPLKEYLNGVGRAGTRIFKSDYQIIAQRFRYLQESLGLKPQSLHITRHTYASLLIDGGIKPTLAQQMLGHSTLMMTELYTHYLKSESDKSELEKALF